jgi:hypothetical protein
MIRRMVVLAASMRALDGEGRALARGEAFVVNDRDQLRGCRVDRIAGVRPTGESFQPRFLIEF